jgi:hypothetical protein
VTTVTYTAEEAESILRAAPLMTEAQVMSRWNVSKRWLRALVNGKHPQGVHLPAVALSSQKLRFRPIDVARVEEELWGGD